MKNFEAALRIAVNLNTEITNCTETDNAYLFHAKGKKSRPIVILKSNCQLISLKDYHAMYSQDEVVREFGLVLEDLIIDRWNCCAITNVGINTPEQQAAIDEINAQLD